MADGLNEVHLLGNLGSDPELRMTPNGVAVLKISLATSKSYLDDRRQRQERTEWHRVTVFRKRAEALARLLSKGDKIFVLGELRTTSYERDGEKRYSTEIVAQNIILCGGRGRPSSSSSSSDETGSYDDGDWGDDRYHDDIPF